MTTHTPGLSERMPKRRMGGKLRNNFPSGRPKKISKGPVDPWNNGNRDPKKVLIPTTTPDV